MLGMHGSAYANYAVQECDVLISVGARFDDRVTGNLEKFCPKARIIHIDIDAAELDKIKTAHIGITGDVSDVLQALLPKVQPTLRKRWLSHVAGLKAEHPLQTPGIDDPRTHYGLISAVAAALDDASAAQKRLVDAQVDRQCVCVCCVC